MMRMCAARQAASCAWVVLQPLVGPLLRTTQEACAALLAHAGALAPILEGASLRVSFTNRLSPDGTHIDVAFNFRM